MSQGWYYSQNGQQAGPIDFGQLQQLAARGQVGPSDLVWQEGMPSWAAASTIPGLTPGGAQPGAYGAVQPSPYGGGQPSPYGAAPAGYQQPGGLNYYGEQYPQGQDIYAGFWLRFVASFLDGLILIAIQLPILIPVIISCGGLIGYQGNLGARALMDLVSLLVGWLYFALQESGAAQATLGKCALGLVVVDVGGQRISFGTATGRFFGKLVSYLTCLIGFMMAGLTQQKQALHDMMAGCLVVKKR